MCTASRSTTLGPQATSCKLCLCGFQTAMQRKHCTDYDLLICVGSNYQHLSCPKPRFPVILVTSAVVSPVNVSALVFWGAVLSFWIPAVGSHHNISSNKFFSIGTLRTLDKYLIADVQDLLCMCPQGAQNIGATFSNFKPLRRAISMPPGSP